MRRAPEWFETITPAGPRSERTSPGFRAMWYANEVMGHIVDAAGAVQDSWQGSEIEQRITRVAQATVGLAGRAMPNGTDPLSSGDQIAPRLEEEL